MEPVGRLPEGVAHGIVAFTFTTFLLVVALLPAGPVSAPAPAAVAPPIAIPEYKESDAGDSATLAELLGDGPVLRNATAINDYCFDASPTLPCVETALARYLAADGPADAYALLKQMSENDTGLMQQQHNIAHSLGRVNYFVAGDVKKAISVCPEGMASGCMHGVLETYFGTQAHVNASLIRGLCQEPQDNSGGDFHVFNCLHGLGHGLDMYTGGDWYASILQCDGLAGEWSRSACYGGVFMENIVYDQEVLRGGMPTGHHHGAAANQTYPRTKPEDPRYPCSILADQYLSSCYLMQTSMLLQFHPWDWSGAFAMCAGAPERWQTICYESVGRDVSGATLHNEEATLADCALGNGTLAKTHCLIGAVKDYINTAAALPPGIALCKRADDPYPDACWEGVGQMAAALYPVPANRQGACQPVPEDVRWHCVGVPPTQLTTTMTTPPYIVG